MFSTTTTTIFHTTQLVSLTASLLISGINIGASHLIRPILTSLDDQSVSPANVALLYHRGARLVAPLAVLGTLSSAAMAYQSSANERTMWSFAASCTFASLPLTSLVAKETKRTLLKYTRDEGEVGELIDLKVSDGSEGDKEEVVRVLKRWRRMNLVRSVLALVGGLVATVAVVYRS